ncbi:MAG: DHHA1 domain-containing protein, partial [Vicinamibacterales bacterium]
VRTLNAKPDDLIGALTGHLGAESKLRKEVQQLKTRLAVGGGSGPADDDRVDINGVTLIARQVNDVDKGSLRALADTLKSKLESGIVLLAAPSPDGRVAIIASVTADLTKRTPAGQLVKQLAPIVGGTGGGRPDFAEAGGKDASKIAEMLTESRRLVEGLLAAN